MKTYKVELIAISMAIVHANTPEEAEDIAREMTPREDFDVVQVEAIDYDDAP